MLLLPVVLSTRNISEENIDSVLGGRGRMGVNGAYVWAETDVLSGKVSIRWFWEVNTSRLDLEGCGGVESVRRRGIAPV